MSSITRLRQQGVVLPGEPAGGNGGDYEMSQAERRFIGALHKLARDGEPLTEDIFKAILATVLHAEDHSVPGLQILIFVVRDMVLRMNFERFQKWLVANHLLKPTSMMIEEIATVFKRIERSIAASNASKKLGGFTRALDAIAKMRSKARKAQGLWKKKKEKLAQEKLEEKARRAKFFMEGADVDGDGAMSLQEAMGAGFSKEQFKEMDGDGDGQVRRRIKSRPTNIDAVRLCLYYSCMMYWEGETHSVPAPPGPTPLPIKLPDAFSFFFLRPLLDLSPPTPYSPQLPSISPLIHHRYIPYTNWYTYSLHYTPSSCYPPFLGDTRRDDDRQVCVTRRL